MFEGPIGKKMMINQGYVPPTCTLPEDIAGPLIYSETVAGRDVCAGCNHDREVCKGRKARGVFRSGSHHDGVQQDGKNVGRVGPRGRPLNPKPESDS